VSHKYIGYFQVILLAGFVMVMCICVTQSYSQNRNETPPETVKQTPAPKPVVQPTAVPVSKPVAQPTAVPAASPKPTAKPARTAKQTQSVKAEGEESIYKNVAVIVGVICFFVVFGGLYIIVRSVPSSRSR